MTQTLPDPRPFVGNVNALAQAASAAALTSGDERGRLLQRLAEQISALLEQGDEASVREALNEPGSPQACGILQQALERALAPGDLDEQVCLHVFAIPVLFVIGAQASHRISAVIPDPDAVRSIFEKSGALGYSQNFGLSNALASIDAMDAISWKHIQTTTRAQDLQLFSVIDLPPAEIQVEPGREAVHLRFVCGAALTGAHAPGFVEAAGDIGRWGMELTRELGRQLAIPDVSLLAIPRHPRTIVSAMREGWFAARELGFQLFLSNALRQARARTGEPDVTISATDDLTIRIRLSSPFDDLLDQTYGWPLSASDNLDEITASIFGLLEEARVDRIHVIADIESTGVSARNPH